MQEFVDPNRSPSDVTRATLPGLKKSRGDVSASDLSLANFEHVEGRDMTRTIDSRGPEVQRLRACGRERYDCIKPSDRSRRPEVPPLRKDDSLGGVFQILKQPTPRKWVF